MKKLVFAGLFSAVLMANESGYYVGGDISKVKEEYKTSTETTTNKSTAYALNLGYYFDANTRAYAFYQYIGKGDFDQSTDAYGVGCDYLFGNSSFKPFVGAIVAYSVYKDGDYTLDGFAYGGRMGVNYKINTNVSLDAGYRYLFSDAKTSIDETTYFQGFFAGINYKF